MTEDKVPESSAPERIDDIETHDARISQIALVPGGKGVIDFSHIAVYKEVASGRYDVWSYKAELRLEEITRVEMVGSLAEEDYVSIAKFIDAEGEEIEDLSLCSKSDVNTIQIWMGTGASIHINLRTALLILTTPVEKIDEFIESDSDI